MIVEILNHTGQILCHSNKSYITRYTTAKGRKRGKYKRFCEYCMESIEYTLALHPTKILHTCTNDTCLICNSVKIDSQFMRYYLTCSSKSIRCRVCGKVIKKDERCFFDPLVASSYEYYCCRRCIQKVVFLNRKELIFECKYIVMQICSCVINDKKIVLIPGCIIKQYRLHRERSTSVHLRIITPNDEKIVDISNYELGRMIAAKMTETVLRKII